MSLPQELSKAQLITWSFGEVPLDNDDALTYFSIKGLTTDATRADDVSQLLKFDGSKYDLHLPTADREAADLLRRSVTRGPPVYLKREGATPTRGRQPGWIEDSELLDKLMVTKEGSDKSKYLDDDAFKHRTMGIDILLADGSKVTLTWRGAMLYKYTQAKLVQSVKKLNAMLPASAKRKRGKSKQRFPTQTRLAKRDAKAAKKGSRPRTNTAKVEAMKAELQEVKESREHRTEQRDEARTKSHARKQQLAAVKKWLGEKCFTDFDPADLKDLVDGIKPGEKLTRGGDQKKKAITLLLKRLFDTDGGLPLEKDESEYDSDSEEEEEEEEDEEEEEEGEDGSS